MIKTKLVNPYVVAIIGNAGILQLLLIPLFIANGCKYSAHKRNQLNGLNNTSYCQTDNKLKRNALLNRLTQTAAPSNPKPQSTSTAKVRQPKGYKPGLLATTPLNVCNKHAKNNHPSSPNQNVALSAACALNMHSNNAKINNPSSLNQNKKEQETASAAHVLNSHKNNAKINNPSSLNQNKKERETASVEHLLHRHKNNAKLRDLSPDSPPKKKHAFRKMWDRFSPTKSDKRGSKDNH